MKWIVYDKTGKKKRCEIHKVEYVGSFMADRIVTSSIDAPSPIDFEIFDYIEYRGEKFEIELVPEVKKTSSDRCSYDLRFVSLKYELERCMMRNIVPDDNGIVYPTPLNIEFTGNIKYLSERIQACLDDMYGKNVWTITVAEGTESEEKNITISNQNCWNALSLVNSEYKLNYYITGRSITIGGEGDTINHVFEYGKGKGLYEIERVSDTDTGVVTKLRAYGSTRNLDYSYPKLPDWPDSVLPVNYALSPLRLMLPSFKLDGKTDYVLASEEAIEQYGIREGSITYDDIYPSIAGDTNSKGEHIDEIKNVDAITDEKQSTFTVYLYDLEFEDEDHPEGLIDYLTTEAAQISMKTGALQGYTFNVSKIDRLEDGSYKITLGRNTIENTDTDNFTVPNENWNMKTGDKFVFLNMLMPQKYIRNAENRLLERAKEYLEEYSKTNFSYNVGIDEMFMKQNPSFYLGIMEGKKLIVNDSQAGINNESIIIQSLTISEGEKQIPTFKVTLNNKPSASSLERIQGQIGNIETSVNNTFSTASDLARQYRKKLDTATWDSAFKLHHDDPKNPYKVTSIEALAGLWTNQFLSAKGLAEGSGGGGGNASALYQLVDVTPNASGTGVLGAQDGYALVYDGVSGKWSAKEAGLNEGQLALYLTTNNYAKKSDIPSLAGYATEKWVTDKGYLVATPSDKANWNTAYGWGNHALAGYAKESSLGNYILKSSIGAANGVAPLGADNLIPAAYLPSYVDDVLEFATLSSFPAKGESGKIYVSLDTNLTYRWTGTTYVEISKSIGLGETSSTAYPGNKGKANADAITALRAITISAGTGLTGGGNLTANRTISLSTSGVIAGDYTKVTVDVYGRVTSGTSLIASDIPSLAISKITGLQDALNSKLNSNDFQSKFDAAIAAWFVRDEGNKGIRPAAYQGEEVGFYSNTYLSAKGRAAGSGGGGGGASALYQLLDVIPNASGTGVEGVADGYVLAYDALAGKWKAAQRLDETALKAYLTTNKYATQGWVSSQGYLTQHQSLANYVTLNTDQSITGIKTFVGNNFSFYHTDGNLNIVQKSSYTGGWARGLNFKNDNDAQYAVIGGYGNANTFNYVYIGQSYDSRWITFASTGVKSSVDLEATKFKKTGGTSAQFLKADGSVDSSTYLTTGTASNTYVKKAGDIMTGKLSVPTLTISDITGVPHIAFSRTNYNYITAPGNSSIAFVMHGKSISSTSADFVITNNGIFPGTTGVVTNGRSTERWSNVFSVLGNFSGAVTISGAITAGNHINVSGNITTKGYIDSGGDVVANNYVKAKNGWFQNNVAQAGLYNLAGNARWYWNGSYWYADKSIYSSDNVHGHRLVSRVATGYSPLLVNSTTLVANLNANYVEGYSSINLLRKKLVGSTGDYKRYVILLFQTDEIAIHRLDGYFYAANSGANRYYRTDVSIWHSRWISTAHDGTYSCINKNYQDGGLKLITVTYQGKEYIAMDSANTSIQAKNIYFVGDWTDNARFTLVDYYNTQSNTVLNSEINDSRKDLASDNILVGNNTIAYINSNVASATKLQTARLLWGQSFDGTANVTGELKNVTRVSNATNSNLFLGNSDGTGWVQSINLCASAGTVYWSLRNTGVGHFRRINLGDAEEDNTSYRLVIRGDQFMYGNIVSSWYRVNYSSNNPYYSLTKDSKIAYFQLYDTKAYLGFGTGNSINITQDGKVGIGLGTTDPSYKLHVAGTGYFSGSLTTSGNIATGSNDGAFVRIGNVYLQYDATNNAIKVVKYDGTSANLYATGGLSAKGYAPGSGGGGGGGLIQNVYGYNDLGKTYSNADLDNTFNAYTINQLATRITSLEGGSVMTFNTTGTGEFFSAVSKNGTTVTFTKSTPNYIKSSTTERDIKPNLTGSGLLKLYFVNGSNVGLTSGYADALFLNGYVDNSGGGTNLITFDKRNGEMGLHYQSFNSTTWGARRVVLESSNYSNYTVTKIGGGASGTWGIDITGNANSATSLRDIRTIGISGGATGTATSFNGTSNITIPVTKIDPSKSYYENGRLLIKKIVAQYTSDSSEVTGIIKISLPSGWSATMMGIEIDVYDYSRNAYSKVLVGGYNYTTQAWYNTSVSILGNHRYNVRLGYDGSKCCILLGSATYTWYYPKVVVRNVMSAFSGYMSLNGNWSTSVITSEVGLSSIIEPVVNDQMTVGVSRTCSGNAATASKWATERSISLTGAITGSVSLDGSSNVSLATTFTNSVFDARYVNKTGDTMTGTLSVPTLTISSQDSVEHIKFTRQNINYISSPINSYIAFVTSGKSIGTDNSDVIIGIERIYPGTDNLVNNGLSTHRWKGVYSVIGNFTGTVTAATYKSGKSMFQDGQLELSGATPYIDFHYNNSTADYTHRIIAETADRLNITTGLQVNGVLYGKDKLNIGSTMLSGVKPTTTNTITNVFNASTVLAMELYTVNKDSAQPLFRWANNISTGYTTRYSIGSVRAVGDGFGQLRLWVGNNDAGTAGNWFALNHNGVVSTSLTYFETSNTGFKTGNVVFGAKGSVAEISSATNHLLVSGYSDIHVNYTASGTGRTIPTKWYWHRGAANTWADFEIGLLTTHASAHLGGDVTITDDLNVSGSTTFAGHVIAGMGLDVIDLTYLQDDLQVDGYSSFNSDVTINANLGMRGTIDLIGGTIRGDSSSKIICDGIGISASNKESGCIISGNPNSWSIAIDHNDIQARNNGAWSILYINDYGGDVSITNSSATYSAKILSTKASTSYTTGALTVGGGVGVGGSLYVRNNFVANGSIVAKEPSTSDIRLKNNIRDFNASLILKKIGKPFTFEWNSLARELNSNLSNEHQNFGVSAQRVKEVLPGFTFECYEGGYLGVKYDRFMPIVMAAQLETMGEVEILKREIKELKNRIKILEERG